MKRKVLFTSKKPKYTTTMSGILLPARSWKYLTIGFWGFILFNKTFTNRFCSVTPCIVHFLGFRFSYDYLTKDEIKNLKKDFKRMNNK